MHIYLLLPCILGGILSSSYSNPYLIGAFPRDSPTQYLVFHGPLASDHQMAHSRCLALGGDLVDVESAQLLAYLEARLHEPAFIGSWMGSTYDHCLAIYPGGAVAVPNGGCSDQMASVCEVPIFGTGAIHLDAFNQPADAFLKMDLNFPGSIPASAALPSSIYRVAKMVEVGNSAAGAGNTRTVTIYGAIQTMPGNPCCKC